ncbi:MAG: hypothetical protein OXG49_05495 [Chloroflexi bacterium]|nr:hypothetical protein [Chloroflexota bacterium]
MDKKTILKGMWWIKGNEKDKFAGILTYGGGYVPTLEIFPKEFEWDKQKVPNNSTIYGDVFVESKKIQAVTLLECTSENSIGSLDVGAFIYKQEFVYARCVAIGMLLDDDEIAQVQSPQNIYLTCPGLDEYSMAHSVDYVWKDNIPKGRAYHINDLEKIIYTPPEPIEIEIDIGTITITLGPSSTSRNLSTEYLIHIGLANPTQQAEVNSLIYSQFLTFLSIMTGRREHIRTHNVSIDSEQTRSGSLSLELNYGQTAYSTQATKHSIRESLLIGREENMRKFATLFPKWRMNFEFVGDLAFQYLKMLDHPTKDNILRAFSYIEAYALERLFQKDDADMYSILKKIIKSNATYFQSSNIYAQHFPAERRHHTASQLGHFRHKSTHPKSDKECVFSLEEVYAYIDVILRSTFLKEMEYSFADTDNVIGHWQSWHRIAED